MTVYCTGEGQAHEGRIPWGPHGEFFFSLWASSRIRIASILLESLYNGPCPRCQGIALRQALPYEMFH